MAAVMTSPPSAGADPRVAAPDHALAGPSGDPSHPGRLSSQRSAEAAAGWSGLRTAAGPCGPPPEDGPPRSFRTGGGRNVVMGKIRCRRPLLQTATGPPSRTAGYMERGRYFAGFAGFFPGFTFGVRRALDFTSAAACWT